MTRTARAAAAGLAALLLAAAAGCGDGGGGGENGNSGGAPAGGVLRGADAVDCTAPAVLVLAVAAHANVSAPDVPAPLGCLLEATIAAGGAIGVVAIDGTPSVLRQPTAFPVTDANAAAARDDRVTALNSLVGTVRGARADAPGSDVLGAVSLALDAAAAAGSRAGTRVVVLDSGLADTGALKLTATGMLAAEPAEVARFVAAELPAAEGAQVDLVGVGHGVAPQRALGQRERTAVGAIWRAVLERAGAARVTVVPLPRTAPGPRTAFPVRTVEPAPPREFNARCETEVFDDASPLGFEPGGTVFRDPAAAQQAILPTARWVAAAEGRRVVLTGTTASAGTAAQRKRLSRARAVAVRELFTGLGVPADRISVVAAGYRGAPPDHRGDGPLDPAAAALNRTVQVRTTGC